MARIKWPDNYVRFEKDEKEKGFDAKYKAQQAYCKNLIEFDSELGKYVKITHRYSFTAKLKQAKIITKTYYSLLKNEILAYQGSDKELRSEVSFDDESFLYLKTELIKFTIMGRKLRVYFNYDPAKLIEKGYTYVKDVSMRRAHEKTPSQLSITNDYKFNQALEIIGIVLESFGYTKGEPYTFDWSKEHPYKTLKYLVRNAFIIEKRTLIKETKVIELDEQGKANVVKWKPAGFVVTEVVMKKTDDAYKHELDEEISRRKEAAELQEQKEKPTVETVKEENKEEPQLEVAEDEKQEESQVESVEEEKKEEPQAEAAPEENKEDPQEEVVHDEKKEELQEETVEEENKEELQLEVAGDEKQEESQVESVEEEKQEESQVESVEEEKKEEPQAEEAKVEEKEEAPTEEVKEEKQEERAQEPTTQQNPSSEKKMTKDEYNAAKKQIENSKRHLNQMKKRLERIMKNL